MNNIVMRTRAILLASVCSRIPSCIVRLGDERGTCYGGGRLVEDGCSRPLTMDLICLYVLIDGRYKGLHAPDTLVPYRAMDGDVQPLQPLAVRRGPEFSGVSQ
jgi:hypothetical protein